MVCSSNDDEPIHRPCRSNACSNLGSNINLNATERLIQNQARVMESQYADVLGAVTVANDYLVVPTTGDGSLVWGTANNMRNRSDRRAPHGMAHTNVVRRGNSVKSTVTSNRPGGMAPGGLGVDVKHDSYARYLGKLKGQTMVLVSKDAAVPVPTAVTNNKSFGFTLVNSSRCLCRG